MPREARSASTTAQAGVNQRVLLPLILGALAFLAILHLFSWTRLPLMKLDRQLLDGFHLRGGKTPERDDIVILAIDDASLTRAQAWPEDIAASPALQAMEGRYTSWPRRLWAMTLDRLFQAGASQVFLDLTFFGTSTPEDDKALAGALQRHKGKVVIGAKFDTSAVSRLDYPNPSITGRDVPEDGTWGYLNFWPDPDDKVRRARYQTTRWKVEGGVPDPSERPSPSVSLALASRVNVNASADAPEWGRLRFCDPDAYPPLSLHHIFVPDLWKQNFGDGARFKDKIILIGATAQELHDLPHTPLGDLPGVQLHAHALTALLAHSFLNEVPPSWPWFSLTLGAFVAWLLVTTVRQPVLSLLGMWLLTAAAVWLSFRGFNQFDVEASPLTFTLALNLCGVLGLTGNFLSQLRETRKLSRFIQRYHSPDRVAHLLKDRANLFSTLGGVERTVTILFSDVRGFTTLSEGMRPEELVGQLNEYLSKMVEQVFVHEGSIDKFIGDAVMALWGSMPALTGGGTGLKQDAQRAVASALAMRAALEALNIDWRARSMPELRFGIGVHQGPVVVGNIGSAAPYERMELTVIGDSVNLASRLEGLTKDYACDIIISDVVQQQIRPTHLCRPIDLVKVKGKAIPVRIYFVEGPREGREDPAWWRTYEDAIEAFRGGDKPRARDLLEQCKAQAPGDALVNRFLGECG